jgi:hypothetical protein
MVAYGRMDEGCWKKLSDHIENCTLFLSNSIRTSNSA